MRDSRTSLLVLFAFAAATVVTFGQAGAARVTVFHGARLINGGGGPAIENATLAVENQNSGGAGQGLKPFPPIAARMAVGSHVAAGLHGV